MAYAVFLPIVFIVYWAIPHRFRWPVLLAASCYFYMSWNAKYIVLILFTTLVSYTAARLLGRCGSKRQKQWVLFGAAALCLGVLVIFKYAGFLLGNFYAALSAFGIHPHPVTVSLMLPVGISFYTFQTLSYVIDVYRGEIPAEKHFGIYATFVSFFPQLVAGPIERTANLLPQLRKEHFFDADKALCGAKRMLWGFFKKLVIADNLAPFVDMVYADVTSYYGVDFAIVIVFFSVQIYCDFSGYSDIAVGTAKLLGIDLMTNFKSPYLSASIREFWSRWHISLSTWFRDYVYIPLGGNRCSGLRHKANLLATFLLSGLWHGASWNFVAWGGLHGLAQVMQASIPHRGRVSCRKSPILRWLKVGCVFAFCSAAWVFFRAQTLGDAVYVLAHLFDGIGQPLQYLRNRIGLWKADIAVYLPMLAVLFIYDCFDLEGDAIEKLGQKGKLLQWAVWLAVGLCTLIYSQKGVAAEFVYFQF